MAVFAAVLSGAVAYVAARHHLASRERAAEARIAERHEKKPVLVARSDLPAGTVLDADLLAARRIPLPYVSASAARPQDLERVEGQRLLHATRSGEPILWPSLAGGEDATLSAGLLRGRRALTLPVDEVNALAGMLTPGDVIDLLYTGPGSSGAPAVRPLLQRVTVLATGSATASHARDEPDRGAASAEFATITLDVTPEQAQLIVLAQRAGELTAVLRHPADAGTPRAAAIDAGALAERAAPRPTVVRRDYVEVITGGSRGLATLTRVPAGEHSLRSTPSPAAAEPRESRSSAPDPGDLRTRLGLDRPPAT